jgi:hypothetical protein
MKILFSTVVLFLIFLVNYGKCSEYEEEFSKGKAAQLKAIKHLTGNQIPPEKSFDNKEYWQEIRNKVVELKQYNQVDELITLLNQSNNHFEKCAKLHPRFPYPHLYMGINYCIGSNLMRANQTLLELQQLETLENVSEKDQKQHHLKNLIEMHEILKAERTAQTEYANAALNFDRKLASGIAILVAYAGREWLLQGLCNTGDYFFRRWNPFVITCPHIRQDIPLASYLEYVAVMSLIRYLMDSLFYYHSPYAYFSPTRTSKLKTD